MAVLTQPQWNFLCYLEIHALIGKDPLPCIFNLLAELQAASILEEEQYHPDPQAWGGVRPGKLETHLPPVYNLQGLCSCDGQASGYVGPPREENLQFPKRISPLRRLHGALLLDGERDG